MISYTYEATFCRTTPVYFKIYFYMPNFASIGRVDLVPVALMEDEGILFLIESSSSFLIILDGFISR